MDESEKQKGLKKRRGRRRICIQGKGGGKEGEDKQKYSKKKQDYEELSCDKH